LEPSIVCPSCLTEIKLTETLAAPLIEAAKRDSEAKLRLKEAEIGKREEAIRQLRSEAKTAQEQNEAHLNERLQAERKKLAEEEARKARAAVATDMQFQTQQLDELKKAYEEREAKLAEAQKAQAEAVRKTRELAEKERELDLAVEKRVQESQAQIRERAKAETEQTLLLRVHEKEQTILGMQKQIEELKRKSEQGSQQLQGEVQELQLEALLQAAFPNDAILPVPKGEFGGDALQKVATPGNPQCGKILWESKRTRNWSEGWLQKLRDDQRLAGADAAILVSQALPKEIAVFGHLKGIWITAPHCAMAVAAAIRQGLIDAAAARRAAEGQNTKMEMMYHYLTGPHFRHRVQAMAERLRDMQADLDKERKTMQRAWAKREQQILGVASATSQMWGEMQGIAGQSLKEIEGLDFDGGGMIGDMPGETAPLRLIETGV
jgi:hypothetical protein